MDSKQDAINGWLEEKVRYKDRAIDVVKRLVEGKDQCTVKFIEEVREPIRQESPARNHQFLCLDGFCKYLNEYGGDNTVVLADPVRGIIKAILNDRAQKGFEIIDFRPMQYPSYADWRNRFNNPMPIQDFAKFVIGQKQVIIEPSAKELSLTLSQIKMSKEVVMQSGTGKHAINGVMVTTTIQGQNRTELFELPDEITISCPMFVERPVREILVDVVIDVRSSGEGKHIIMVELISADAQAQEINEIREIIEEAKANIKKGVFSLGWPLYSEWKYIR